MKYVSRKMEWLAALFAMLCLASLAQATPTSVPLGGNAFITRSLVSYDEVIQDQGLGNWTSPNTTISVYLKVLQAGSLSVGLVGSLNGATHSTAKVSIGNQSYVVNLSGTTNQVFPAGTFTISAPGYVKVNLQALTSDGDYYGDISALQIDGSATAAGVVFANDPTNFYWSRRGPSVHLSYTVPANTEYFYSEVTVPEGQDTVGSYFMANGFNVGYFGMQVNSPTERWVLFSVWDPDTGSTTLVKAGPDVILANFGGEGTGGQSHLIFNWVAGETYQFLTRAHPDGAGNTQFSAWFRGVDGDCDAQGGKNRNAADWHFIATWNRPNTNSYHAGVYSFIENFDSDTGYIGRKAYFGNQWALNTAGLWTEITSAWYDVDPTGYNNQRQDYAGGAIKDQFFLQNDGFFSPFVPQHQTFIRRATRHKPDVDVSHLP